MDNKKNNEQLDITIRFIEETKNGAFGDVPNSDSVLVSRADEPTIYASETEEPAFLSFCN